MHVLTFRLEAPLQSWSYLSFWDVRNTSEFPTKSGVLGLLCSCMGWGRDDTRIPQLSGKIVMGARADRRGIPMSDFHTTQPTFGGKFTKMNGRTDDGNSTIVSRRDYLQDASFVVAIHADDDALLDEIQHGLCHPAHTVFLGRKSCIPSAPFQPQIVNCGSLEEALTNAPRTERSDTGDLPAEIDADAARADEHSQISTRVDTLASDFIARTFVSRKVIVKALHVPESQTIETAIPAIKDEEERACI